MSYLEYLAPKRLELSLAGRRLVVERAPLGRFFALAALERCEDELKVLRYLALATGLDFDELARAGALEVFATYQALTRLNRLEVPFPFLRGHRGRDPLDYPGRELASIVHLLASTYHWPREAILALQVEEALFYCLEILADRHDRQAWEYTLSQVGFDDQGRKVPFPKLGWYWPGNEPKRPALRMTAAEAARRGLIPLGGVIDLQERYRNGSTALN